MMDANTAMPTHIHSITSVIFLGTPRKAIMIAMKNKTDVSLPNHLDDISIFFLIRKSPEIREQLFEQDQVRYDAGNHILSA